MPSVPGLVSEIVVPSKSAAVSFPRRARETTSSAAADEFGERHLLDARMFGTRRVREPSDFSTSTASPNRISSRFTRTGPSADTS